MNEKAPKPLVEKIIGGKNGSGANLTNEGEKMIEKFYEIENEIKMHIENKYKHLVL